MIKAITLALALTAAPAMADDVDELCTNLSIVAAGIADMRDQGVGLSEVIMAIQNNSDGFVEDMMINVAVATYNNRATAAQAYQAMNEACYSTMGEAM